MNMCFIFLNEPNDFKKRLTDFENLTTVFGN